MTSYELTVSRKVGMLATVVAICNIVIIYIFNQYFSLSPFAPVVIGFLPVIFFGGYYLRWAVGKIFVVELARCKYSRFAPFYFYHQQEARRGPRVDVEAIRNLLQPGDVILRRQEGYLDGIVFSANSFFTHAGICCNRAEGMPLEIMHANVEQGVHPSTIESFCQADDIAILRFSPAPSPREAQMLAFIENEPRPTHDIDVIKDREFKTFNSLYNRFKPPGGQFDYGDNQAGDYHRIIIDRAYSLQGEHYDINFEFSDFTRFSCIEFVWYCYKSLFPLHRISVEDFEFFGIFKLPVIVPDVFIHNDFFEYVYSTVPKTGNKDLLMKHVKKPRKQLLYLAITMLSWNALIMVVANYFFKINISR